MPSFTFLRSSSLSTVTCSFALASRFLRLHFAFSARPQEHAFPRLAGAPEPVNATEPATRSFYGSTGFALVEIDEVP